MQIKINVNLFIFIIIFYITRQIEIYALLMLFAFVHEIGHVISGIILGFRPKSLHIMPFGIAVEFNTYVQDYNKKIICGNILNLKKLLIALAGPMTNFIIILICYMWNGDFYGINSKYIIYANLLLGIFNLLPIYPLDGGRIMKEIITIFYGRREALNFTNKVSNINLCIITAVSSVAIYYFKNIAILLIIIYLWIVIIRENRKYNINMKIYKQIKKGEIQNRI